MTRQRCGLLWTGVRLRVEALDLSLCLAGLCSSWGVASEPSRILSFLAALGLVFTAGARMYKPWLVASTRVRVFLASQSDDC